MLELDEIAENIRACQRCPLAQNRTKAVPGEGPENPKIVFIGEAPGWHEDQQGRPFVGPAGQFLEELLASVGLKRSEVYIANVIKCRPPGNRDPLPEEVEACSDWLTQQLECLKPRIIVTLGRYSMARFFPRASISKIHGMPAKRDGLVYYPMYHPAAALHQGSLRKAILQDFKKLPQLLAECERMADDTSQPQQLSLL